MELTPEIPEFIESPELWRVIEIFVSRVNTEGLEEGEQLIEVRDSLLEHFRQRELSLQRLIDYLSLLLLWKKKQESIDRAYEESSEIRQSLLRAVSLSDYNDRELEDNLTNYKNNVEELRLALQTIQSVIERYESESSVLEEQLGELSLLVGYNLEQDQSSDMEEIVVKRGEIIRIYSGLVSYMQVFQSAYAASVGVDSGEDENEEEEEAVADPTASRVEVREGMTEAQERVFLAVESEVERVERRLTPDEQAIKNYITECDVVMHLPLFVVIEAMNDTEDVFIRNMFEVGRSGGSNDRQVRSGWESKIFDSEEYDRFQAHDKVKYGSVNLDHSKQGVNSLRDQYGKSYLILADKVKSRCTYSKSDSSKQSVAGPYSLGTLRYMSSLIGQFKEAEKKRILRPKNSAPLQDQILSNYTDYMEVQIHGELIFSRDVKRMMIDRDFYSPLFLDTLGSFLDTIGREIPYQFI